MTDKMQTYSELPQRFWKIRDAAVEHVISKSPLPAELCDLQDWFDGEGWDCSLAAWERDGEVIAIKLKDLASSFFDDYELRDAGGLDSSDVITHAMRISFSRSVINKEVEQPDGYISPGVHSSPLQRNDGKCAILACTVEVHGQGGPVSNWHGVFADKAAFYAHLRKTGFLLLSEADEISDAALLALWRVEKKKPAKRKKKSP